jgi:hypothetical protein
MLGFVYDSGPGRLPIVEFVVSLSIHVDDIRPPMRFRSWTY